MKRLLLTTGFAAAFAAGLAAQATTGTSGTAQDPQTTTGGQRGGGPRTITGCVRAGDTAGSYLLTNIEGMGGRRGGDATAGATTTGGTTTGTATTGTTAAGDQGRGPGGPMTLMLAADSSVDLKPHVGHKVEVTGTLAGGRGQGGATTGTGTATGTGTTTGGGTTTGTATATGTSATTTGGQGRGMRSMTVTAIKMVSESCS